MTSVQDDMVRSRPLRKDAVRNRLLLIAAAREVFAERGLEASLDDVAHRAGLGVGTAYRHFANKYELAGAVFEPAVADIVTFATAAAAADDPWRGLSAFLHTLLELQTGDRGLREVLAGLPDDRLADPITTLVDRARASGAVRPDCAPSDLAMIVMMLCHVADLAGNDSPQLWRRYLPLLLQSLRPSQIPLDVAPLTEEQTRTALAGVTRVPRRAPDRRRQEYTSDPEATVDTTRASAI